MPRRLVRRNQTGPEPEVEQDGEVELDAKTAEPRPTPLLYNVADACYILGKISKQMLYRQIHLGRLHPLKMGTRSLFTMDELERFVKEVQTEPVE